VHDPGLDGDADRDVEPRLRRLGERAAHVGRGLRIHRRGAARRAGRDQPPGRRLDERYASSEHRRRTGDRRGRVHRRGAIRRTPTVSDRVDLRDEPVDGGPLLAGRVGDRVAYAPASSALGFEAGPSPTPSRTTVASGRYQGPISTGSCSSVATRRSACWQRSRR
jgi:hypothetical protein